MTAIELLEALYNVPFDAPVKLYSDEYGEYYDATKASFTEKTDTNGNFTGKCFLVE